MIVYDSKNISINYVESQDMLLSTWKDTKLDTLTFMKELQICRDFSINLNVKRAILNQEKFNYVIPPKLFPWIEEEINVPGYKNGVEDFVFVVAGTIMSQFSVMDSFDVSESVFVPKFFLYQNEAEQWISSKKKEKKTIINPNTFMDIDPTINIIKDETKNSAIIQLEVPLEALPYNLNILKKHMDSMAFMRKNWKRFCSLTQREKVILKHLVKGSQNKEISEKLYISDTTVKTHRRNIIKKLEARHLIDLYTYAMVFGVI